MIETTLHYVICGENVKSFILKLYMQGRKSWGVCGGGVSHPPPKFEIHSFVGQNSAIHRAKEEAGISKRI